MAPQLLVSARFCLHCVISTQAIQQASLRITIQIISGTGFPEFTQFFNHSHLWKLQYPCMNFSMTVGAQQDAFIYFFSNLLPASRISFVGYAEVFLRRVEMVKFQSLSAKILTAHLAMATFVGYCHKAYPFSSCLYSFNQVLPTFLIRALLCHYKYHASTTAGCSAIELLRNNSFPRRKAKLTRACIKVSTINRNRLSRWHTRLRIEALFEKGHEPFAIFLFRVALDARVAGPLHYPQIFLA